MTLDLREKWSFLCKNYSEISVKAKNDAQPQPSPKKPRLELMLDKSKGESSSKGIGEFALAKTHTGAETSRFHGRCHESKTSNQTDGRKDNR